jgi:glycosyltransferase involved in cell wall biosynthesis
MHGAGTERSHPGKTRSLEGRDMLCFSHDWSGDPLSKTHLMRLMSRHNRVLWVNSIGYRAPSASAADVNRALEKLKLALQPISQPEPNIFVLNPLAVPAYGVSAVRTLNKHLLRLQILRAMRTLGFSRPINWVFNPAASVIAGELGESLIVYYCVDEYTAFAGVPSESLVALENELLQQADLVIVSAERLLRTKSGARAGIKLVRHGVDYEHFRRALSPELQVPAEIASLPRPIIGYFGLMADDWIDVDLLVHVAKHFSSGSMVLLGKVTSDLSRLAALPNVHILGRKPFADLPAYSKGFDVGILPFPITEVTLAANPLKVREYIAAGLPVVSTKIPEVEVLGLCRIGDGKAAFCHEIEEALKDPGPKVERSLTMQKESWEARLADIDRLVADLPGA